MESYYDQHNLYELREAVSVIIAQNRSYRDLDLDYVPDSLSETLALETALGGGFGGSSRPSDFTSW